MSPCTREQFSIFGAEQAQKMYEKQAKMSATNVCVDNIDQINLRGIQTSLVTKTLILTIQKCSGDHCEMDPRKIKEFLEDIQVYTKYTKQNIRTKHELN